MRRHNQVNSVAVKMAQDLKLTAGDDPVGAILEYCERRIMAFEPPPRKCETLLGLLDMVAANVRTKFIIIESDDQLDSVCEEYLAQGEKVFTTLKQEFSSERMYGITYRLQNPKGWDRPFVSIIDSRGTKAARAYFTKWHEVAHLLTLADNARAVFRRTHELPKGEDLGSRQGRYLPAVLNPEEQLMDTIAGKFGFFTVLTRRYMEREISFDEIERMRMLLCHEASRQAALNNFVKYWPKPCIYLRAEVGLTRSQDALLRGRPLDDMDLPEPALRIVSTNYNEKSHRVRGFVLFNGAAVPERSVVHRAFMRGRDDDEAEEELSWWGRQSSGRVRVKARAFPGSVEALIIPLDYKFRRR